MKDLELKRAELDEGIKNFNTAHQAYHGQLEDRGSSSMSGARVAAAAKRASLAAEAAMLRKQQALEQEELRLQQRKQQLALETEIVKVKAEECVRAEVEARFTPSGKNKGVRSIIPPVFITDFCEPEVSKVMLSDTQRLSTRTEQLPISDLSDGSHRHSEVDSCNSIASEEGFRQFMDLQCQQEQNRSIMHIQ